MLCSIQLLKKLFPNYEGRSAASHIDSVVLDSREKMVNSLFVPIVGERFNAHDYINQAVENGVVATLWDRKFQVPTDLKNKCYFFYVEDTVTGLQKLAQYYRKEVNPIVIGVTGSNGKTTTKDLIASVIKTTYKTHKTKGNYNNHIGLPLTILQMPRDTEVLVLEMGMNDFGEIDRLSRLASPDYAVITNIGESHIEFLGSREGIAKAKLEITNGLNNNGTLIIDGDEQLLDDVHDNNVELIRCNFKTSHRNSFTIDNVKVNVNSTIFEVNGEQYTIPLIGAHHAKNATYALVLAKKLNISNEQIYQGFTHVEQSEMRFEKMYSNEGAVIINDAYNASPTSMKAAIDVIKNLENVQTKILVLGDIFELGERAQLFHEQIGESISPPINVVFTLGNHAENITNIVREKYSNIVCEHFTNEQTLIEKLQPYMKENSVILFKASRGMALENIIHKMMST